MFPMHAWQVALETKAVLKGDARAFTYLHSQRRPRWGVATGPRLAAGEGVDGVLVRVLAVAISLNASLQHKQLRTDSRLQPLQSKRRMAVGPHSLNL